MYGYIDKDMVRLAKRVNNKKRTYLLVNPLQAKHIPVSPSKSLRMMRTLGKLLSTQYPETRLIIGLAETATAIGAAVSECFSSKCVYVQTTRETVPSISSWIEFTEDHSHAVNQKIAADEMENWIFSTETIIIVDDEISTGKTLLNMIEQLTKRFPTMEGKKVVIASLVSHMSKDSEDMLKRAGILCSYLVKIPAEDYSDLLGPLNVFEAPAAMPVKLCYKYEDIICDDIPDPRRGVNLQESICKYDRISQTISAYFLKIVPQNSSVLILGTEECMYPALRIGEALENANQSYNVMCYATTRSPIGICNAPGYPIANGYKVRSFYEAGRNTYLYNPGTYDSVIVVSDTHVNSKEALDDVAGVFSADKRCRLFYVQSNNYILAQNI